MKVFKFGGASINNAERIKNISSILNFITNTKVSKKPFDLCEVNLHDCLILGK